MLGCAWWGPSVIWLSYSSGCLAADGRQPTRHHTSLRPCEASAGLHYTSSASYWSTRALMEVTQRMHISVRLCLTRTPALGMTNLFVLLSPSRRLALDLCRKPLWRVMLWKKKGVLQECWREWSETPRTSSVKKIEQYQWRSALL